MMADIIYGNISCTTLDGAEEVSVIYLLIVITIILVQLFCTTLGDAEEVFG